MDQDFEKHIIYSECSYAVEELDIDIKYEELDIDIKKELDNDAEAEELELELENENLNIDIKDDVEPEEHNSIWKGPNLNIFGAVKSTTNNHDIYSNKIIDKSKTNRQRPRVILKLPLQDKYMAERDRLRYSSSSENETGAEITIDTLRNPSSSNNSNKFKQKVAKKKFSCQVCPYKTNKGYILKRHMKIHTGEKEFQCHICDYKSSTKINLETHLKTHTGELSNSENESPIEDNSDVNSELIIENDEDSPVSFVQNPEDLIVKGNQRTEEENDTSRGNVQSTLNFVRQKFDDMKKSWDVGGQMLSAFIDKDFLKDCLCSDVSACCCKYNYDLMRTSISNYDARKHREATVLTKASDSDFSNEFFTIGLGKNLRHFCKTCYKNESKESTKLSAANWISTGRSFKTLGEKNSAMKKHLVSAKHAKNSKIESNESLSRSSFTNWSKKCNENFCLAGVFCAIHKESSRFYTDLCEFIEMIGRNTEGDKFKHPLGNKYQHKMGIIHAQIACYDSIREKRREHFKEELEITQLARRVMVAVDKETMTKDISRQVIVATTIGKDGLPQDTIITASGVADESVVGTTDHFKKECKDMFPLKNLIGIATDSAAYYVGPESGMVSRLKRDIEFNSKFVFMADFCHKIERLFFNDPPKWLLETICNNNYIVQFVNSTSAIDIGLFNYSKISNKVYITMPNVPEARFTKHGHMQTQAILKNLDILVDFLPHVISSDEYKTNVKADALRVLHYITDRSYLGALLWIDDIYFNIAKIEKLSRTENFNSINYLGLCKKFKSYLTNKIYSNCADIANVLEKGIIRFSFRSNNVEQEFECNISEVQDKLNKKLRRDCGKLSLDFITEFKDWLGDIIETYDEYLIFPDCFNDIEELFSKSLSKEEKIVAFRRLFNKINTSFKDCGEFCEGIEKCSCVSNEVSRFLEVYEKIIENNVTNKIAYFLNNDNIDCVKKLDIVNVARVLEVVQLLKPCHSSTERVMSFLKKVVEGHFENIYRCGKDHEIDMVNVNTQIGFGCEIHKFDLKNAAEKLGDQNISVVWKNKDPRETSKTLKRIFEEQNQSQKKKKPRIIDEYTLKSVTEDCEEAVGENSPENVSISIKNKLSKKQTKDVIPENLLTGTISGEESIKNENIESISSKINEMNTSTSSNLVNTTKENDSIKKNDKKEIYCCKEKRMSDEKCKVWVQCSNKKYCQNYKLIKNDTGCVGGDWFHFKCTKLKVKPSKNQTWRCSLCKFHDILENWL